MRMHENRYIDILLKLIYLVLIGGAVWLFFKYAFGWTIPLIIAYLLSRLILRPVEFLCSKLKMNRKAATVLCTLLAVSAFCWLVFFLVSNLLREGLLLAQDLPVYLSSLQDKISQAGQTLNAFLARRHLNFFDPALLTAEGLLRQIKLPTLNLTRLLNTVGSAASSVPSILITLVFILLGTYFMCSENKKIFGFLSYQMGPAAADLARKLRGFLYNSVGKWLRAQCILICVTFCELSVGFFILGLPYAGLLALIIAFVDALPILGVGTALLPWAAVSLLTGEFRRALTLLILYLVVLTVRNMIEPRIVGGQLGLDPFATLLCIYFGYRIAGFAGMFIVPVIVLTVIKLQEWGYINLSRRRRSRKTLPDQAPDDSLDGRGGK